jgi:hypothetical protein
MSNKLIWQLVWLVSLLISSQAIIAPGQIAKNCCQMTRIFGKILYLARKKGKSNPPPFHAIN